MMIDTFVSFGTLAGRVVSRFEGDKSMSNTTEQRMVTYPWHGVLTRMKVRFATTGLPVPSNREVGA
jgi:hypothetical protein